MDMDIGFFKTTSQESTGRVNLVLFDLDNTLAYREHHFARAMIEILRCFPGHDFFSIEDLHREFLGKSIERCWQSIRGRFLANVTRVKQDKIIFKLKKKYLKNVQQLDYEAHQRNALFLPDAMNVLNQCHQHGIPVGIVSGSSRDEIKFIIRLGRLNIRPYHVWGAEDYAPHSKPHPHPYHQAFLFFHREFKRRGKALHKSDVVVLEDSISGAQSAQAAELHCVVRPKDHDVHHIGMFRSLPGVKVVDEFSAVAIFKLPLDNKADKKLMSKL